MDQIVPAATTPQAIPGSAAVGTHGHADRREQANTRSLVIWLVASAVCVILTLIIGGITRLTESGLSITVWEPVSGVLPPLNEADWTAAFQRYLAIPEAQSVHRGITLPQFKTLFWWEWAHRLIARIAGLVIAVPFFILWAKRKLPQGRTLPLLALPLLIAAQGALGWYMVSSGLSERTDVSQYRLVAHLGLALVIYVIAVWTAMEVGLGHNDPQTPGRPGTRARPAMVIATLTFITLLSGGFVAGLDAGHVYNTFPLMGPSLVPDGYGQMQPLWRNWFENPAAVQFNHRALAMLLLMAVAWAWARERRSASTRRMQLAWNVIALAALLQVTLGIATLLLAVPIPIAALHQLGAVALLTAALWAAALASARPASRQSSTSSSRASSTARVTRAMTPES